MRNCLNTRNYVTAITVVFIFCFNAGVNAASRGLPDFRFSCLPPLSINGRCGREWFMSVACAR